ncbi:hypothetical protein LTR50_001907 [Elasticomyces elasticus]|nr:hypothetical protein LTR50_001907 [Elasticomyces elasticus]
MSHYEGKGKPAPSPGGDTSDGSSQSDVTPKDELLTDLGPAPGNNRAPNSSSVDITIPPMAEKAIRPVGTLHLTLGVMSLNKEQLQQAIEKLNNLDLVELLQEAAGNTKSSSGSHAFVDCALESMKQGKKIESGLTGGMADDETSDSYSAKTTGVTIDPEGLCQTDTQDRLRDTNLQTVASLPFETELDNANPSVQRIDRSVPVTQATTLANEDLPSSERNSTIKVPSSLNRPISPPLSERSTAVARPLTISLTSLYAMHAPHKTSILYASPTDSTNRLYSFCNGLRTIFTDSGFLLEDTRSLKLHATIVNTIYVKGCKSAGHGPEARAPLRFDATAVLQQWHDHVWAKDVLLDRVAICEMGAKKVHDAECGVVGEEYTEVAVVRLPGAEIRSA